MPIPWEFRKLAGRHNTMANVSSVVFKTYKMRNMFYLYAIMNVCSLREKYAQLCFDISLQTRVPLDATGCYF